MREVWNRVVEVEVMRTGQLQGMFWRKHQKDLPTVGCGFKNYRNKGNSKQTRFINKDYKTK